MEEKLLRAKLALIGMIHEYMYITTLDGEPYYNDCCSSVGEAAFSVLEIKEDMIKIKELCELQERLTRKLWSITLPNEEYGGLKAEEGKRIYYQRHMK